MDKMTVDPEHYYALVLSLEHMIQKSLSENEINSSLGFGIVMALTNPNGETKTYLIRFYNNTHSFVQIENNRFPSGKIIVMFDDKGDLVTQAALTGSEIIEKSLGIIGLNKN